jgi:hypothetical protein
MFATSILGFDWSPYRQYLPYVVGCGVATAVFALYMGRRMLAGRADQDHYPDRPLGVSTVEDEKAFGDRRTAVRREGQPVEVHISSPAFHGETRSGWVMDRSTGGLRITTSAAVAPGTAMQILADNAPDTTPWVTVIVRSCKPNGKNYELGCEFETTPPWNVLLLFG